MYKNIRLLALFNFFTDFRLYSAVLVIYFAKVTGSYALAMSLFSVTMVSSAIFEIPTGIFSDYFGRKKTMVLGAVCSVLSVTFYALGVNYLILFVGALFEGLQRAWHSGNNDALLYETLSDSNRENDYDHYMGKTHAMFQLAAAVAIILGGFAVIRSFALVMWLSVIPQIICLIVSLLVIEPSRRINPSSNVYSHFTASFKKIWTNKKLRLLSVYSIIKYTVGESAYEFMPAFVNALWPLWAVGFSKIISSLGAATSYWYGGKLVRKFGAFRLLLVSNIYGNIINIGSVAMPTIISPVLLSSTSIFYGATGVAQGKLMQKEFTDEQRATLGSINSAVRSIAFGVFTVILGVFADKFGPTRALLFAYLFALPTLLIIWNLFKHNRNE